MDLHILDLDALKASCEPLGLEFHENQKHHKAWSTGECDHAIAVRGNSNAYEIGVVKNPIGAGWSLRADEYGGGNGLMDKIGGIHAGKLRQEYALQVAQKKVPRGFRTQRVVTTNGHIQLRCTR